jgi:hypothetical protein
MEKTSGGYNLTPWNRRSSAVFVRACRAIKSSVTLVGRLWSRRVVATPQYGELSVFLQVRKSRKLLLSSVAYTTLILLVTAEPSAEITAGHK